MDRSKYGVWLAGAISLLASCSVWAAVTTAPIAQYTELMANLNLQNSTAIYAYLNAHGDEVYGKRLRCHWLKYLAQKREWAMFRQDYRDTTDPDLICYNATALYFTGAGPEVWDNIKTLWLVPQSQSHACNEIFKLWHDTGHLTVDLVWQRFILAVTAGNTGLQNYLMSLAPASTQQLMNLYQQVQQTPARIYQINASASTQHRDIIVHGILKMGQNYPEEAIKAYLHFQHAFSVTDANRIERQIAITYALRQSAKSREWFAKFPVDSRDELAIKWRARASIGLEDWGAFIALYRQLPTTITEQDFWQYWYARALLKLGQTAQAKSIMKKVAEQRSYYGFLASSHLGIPVQLNNHVPTIDPDLYRQIEQANDIQHAKQLFQMGQLSAARQAWDKATHLFDDQHCYIGALLAHHWGWHNRAIVTAQCASEQGNLDVRFPTPYKRVVLEQAKKYHIPPALIYAVIRKESAFQWDAVSPDGAEGLMQLLPSTAKLYSKEYQQEYLFKPEHNIVIGTRHMRQTLKEFQQQYIPTIASYNAGRKQVRRWLQQRAHHDITIWIETLPWYETRNYVQSVLAYAIIYQSHLGQRPSLAPLLNLPNIFR